MCRELFVALLTVALAGCTATQPTVREVTVKCPPEKVELETLPFPEYEGKGFTKKGIESLLRGAKAANDSRDVVIRTWEATWDECPD